MTAIVRVDPILDELERMLGKSGLHGNRSW
jgi:hypothetical protein